MTAAKFKQRSVKPTVEGDASTWESTMISWSSLSRIPSVHCKIMLIGASLWKLLPEGPRRKLIYWNCGKRNCQCTSIHCRSTLRGLSLISYLPVSFSLRRQNHPSEGTQLKGRRPNRRQWSTAVDWGHRDVPKDAQRTAATSASSWADREKMKKTQFITPDFFHFSFPCVKTDHFLRLYVGFFASLPSQLQSTKPKHKVAKEESHFVEDFLGKAPSLATEDSEITRISDKQLGDQIVKVNSFVSRTSPCWTVNPISNGLCQYQRWIVIPSKAAAQCHSKWPKVTSRHCAVWALARPKHPNHPNL